MSTLVSLSVEIELPETGDDEQDAIADNLTSESRLLRLRSKIVQWARLISGAPCRVEITVD